tara:strand:- start:1518 stop:2543 length:1026 start_codon:yes stop_codon:yes gene_type:complete
MNQGYNLKDLEDMKKKAVPCPKLCELYYNFGSGRNVTVTNSKKWVAVEPVGPAFKGAFDYQGVGSLTVSKIKLFSPSLNKYNNVKQAAELIIESSGGGQNIIFYIPIKQVADSISKTFLSLWVSSWVNTLSNNAGEKATSGELFSLNDIIPRSGFFVTDGPAVTMTDLKAKNIFFEKPLALRESQLKKLRKLIIDTEVLTSELKADKNFSISYNKVGTNFGPGKLKKGLNQEIKCVPIVEGDGGPIEGDGVAEAAAANAAAAAADTPTKSSFQKWWEDPKNLPMVIMILAILPLIGLIWVFKKWGIPYIKNWRANKAAKNESGSSQEGGNKSRRRSRRRKR